MKWQFRLKLLRPTSQWMHLISSLSQISVELLILKANDYENWSHCKNKLTHKLEI